MYRAITDDSIHLLQHRCCIGEKIEFAQKQRVAEEEHRKAAAEKAAREGDLEAARAAMERVATLEHEIEALERRLASLCATLEEAAARRNIERLQLGAHFEILIFLKYC